MFEALIFGLFILWTAAWSTGKLEARWSWLFLPLLAIVGWGALQLRMGWTIYSSPPKRIPFAGAPTSHILPRVSDVRDEESARAFRRVFTIYAFALAVVSVLQYFLGNGRIYWLFEPEKPRGYVPS